MLDPCDRPKWSETISTKDLPQVLYSRLEESFSSEGQSVPDTLTRKEALKLALEWEGIIGFANLMIDFVIGCAEATAINNGRG